jgi:hypothetical protein
MVATSAPLTTTTTTAATLPTTSTTTVSRRKIAGRALAIDIDALLGALAGQALGDLTFANASSATSRAMAWLTTGSGYVRPSSTPAARRVSSGALFG